MGTVYLASKSPRRRAILEGLGLSVRVIASNAHTLYAFEGDETENPGETPEAYVQRTAANKFLEGLAARDAAGLPKDAGPVLAADTVVSIGGDILGKPRDEAEACAFLRRLAGRTHEVRTAVVAGFAEDRREGALSVSEVTFRPMSEEESSPTSARESPTTRRAATASRASPASSSRASPAATPASWGCPSSRRRSCCAARGVRIIG
jgi:septum formation protein